MIDYFQLGIIVVGVVLGGFFGVEYGNWRIGRRLGRYTRNLFEFLEVDPKKFEKLPAKEKRELIGKKMGELFMEMTSYLPKAPKPPPPTRVISLEKHHMYLPHCPKCWGVAAAVEAKPGEWVTASCPTHGQYKQQVPYPKGEEPE